MAQAGNAPEPSTPASTLSGPSLVERVGPNAGRAHRIGMRLGIGRGPENEIVVAEPLVSRFHAEVRASGGGFTLVDLDSKNGTTRNGEPVTGSVELRDGDEIGVAGFILTFHSGEATLTASKQPFRSGLRVDRDRGEVALNGTTLQLTPKEFLTLDVLDRDRGKLVERDALAKMVWPEYDGIMSDENVDQLVSRVRQKIARVDPGRSHLITVRGRGYRLERTPVPIRQ